MRGFADSDGHIGGSGAVADHEANYNDCVGSGHRRKVVIDGIFSRWRLCSSFVFIWRFVTAKVQIPLKVRNSEN